MRSKFSLTLALSIVVLTAIGAQAQTYWERNDKKSDRQTRKKSSVRTIGRQNRVIVVTPDQVVVRPAIRSNIRPVKVRPITPSFSYSRYESRIDDRRYGGGVAEVARLNGYRDGVREGAKDAADGDRYDPFGEHAYKDGATGYISKYGNRGEYQRYYRQSFVRGYKESFERYLGNYERRNW